MKPDTLYTLVYLSCYTYMLHMCIKKYFLYKWEIYAHERCVKQGPFRQ
jgi:hypothetical protein